MHNKHAGSEKTMKLKQLTTKTHLKMLIYGVPGVGKTSLLATAALDARMTPILWIDCAGNPLSIAHTFARHGKNYNEADVTIVTLDAFNDLIPLYNWLESGQPHDHFAASHGLQKYKTIVIDGISELQDMAFEATQGVYQPGAKLPQRSPRVFGDVLGMMIIITRKMYALPLHVISTALESRTQVADEILLYQPLLQGQARHVLPGWILNVGHLQHTHKMPLLQQATSGAQANNAYHVLTFKPTTEREVKNQHQLPEIMIDPYIGDMLDHILDQDAEYLSIDASNEIDTSDPSPETH